MPTYAYWSCYQSILNVFVVWLHCVSCALDQAMLSMCKKELKADCNDFPTFYNGNVSKVKIF